VPPTRVRPFARSDRDQLTSLVNAHLSAVTPGASVSVQALLSHLEREPGEFIVDPWVGERVTLVAEQRQRVVAAAHLLRYRSDAAVGEQFRDTAEIRWLVCWPVAPFWPDADEAGRALMAGCLEQLYRWRVLRIFADGTLPGPGVNGLPEQWPHITALYEAAGFRGGRTETVLIATVEQLLATPPRPQPGLSCLRTLGVNGTRFSALDADSTVLGYLEVAEAHRRRGVATWLLLQAAAWLELGGISRLLAYLSEDDGPAEQAFYPAVGFQQLTRTRRLLELS